MLFSTTSEKAMAYLPGSYVLVRGKEQDRIAYVDTRGERALYLYFGPYALPNGESSFKLSSSTIKQFEFLPPELGYIPCDYKAYYVERLPKRGTYRLGVCDRSVTNPEMFGDVGVDSIITGLTRCMNKDYKSFEEARTSKILTPFSRRFATDNSGSLYYKNTMMPLRRGNTIEVDAATSSSFFTSALASLTNGYYRIEVKEKKVIDYDGDL